jgi:hypothetical protein
MKAVEWENPSRGRKLRGPYDIELEDVGITRSRVQPLDVELMPLVRGIGSISAHDSDGRVLRIETSDLSREHLGFGPEGAPRKRDDDRAGVGGAAAAGSGEDESLDDAPGGPSVKQWRSPLCGTTGCGRPVFWRESASRASLTPVGTRLIAELLLTA